MCHKINNIAKAKHGQLTKCDTCNLYHLIFNNVFLELTAYELKNFKQYIMQLEIELWENHKGHVDMRRKIPIPTTQHNLVMVFDKHEIEELKALLFCNKENDRKLLRYTAIDYSSFLN